MSRDDASVLDIVHADRQIFEFTRDMDYAEFKRDLKTPTGCSSTLDCYGRGNQANLKGVSRRAFRRPVTKDEWYARCPRA